MFLNIFILVDLGFSELRASGKSVWCNSLCYRCVHHYTYLPIAIYSAIHYVMIWTIQSPRFSSEFSY